jgi:CHAT domain-containing protein/Tfp pilus assembly protein PilF
MGQAEQALPYFRQSVEMKRKLFPASQYPDGHPDLAISLNNLGAVLESMGQTEQALGYFRQSLEMKQKLFPASKYPDGHPELAESFNNMGFVLQALGQAEKALDYNQQSLEMRRRLFPAAKYSDGHPQIAQSLDNLGAVLESMGQAEQALGYIHQSLEIRQKLFPASKYPDGHPDLVRSRARMGFVLQAMGQAKQALPYVRQSLEMQQRLLRRELATASEEAAFDKVRADPLDRDAYLSVTRATKTLPNEVVAQLWPSRSMVTRLLEQRQANARAAGTALGDELDKLRGTRRYLDHLLQDTRRKPDDRDKLIAETMEKRDKLERELIAAIPTLKRWEELDKLGPTDLSKALPPEAVFVDIIRYTHFEYVEKKEKRTPSYVAFVVGPKTPSPPTPLPRSGGEGSIVRVELDAAEPIDAAVRQWRDAIEERREETKAAAELRRLVWDKLGAAIPPGTTTIYLATDGDLARLPWAALPVGGGQVLLEKYAVAQVPHGLFLLDQLKNAKKREGSDSLLTLGGVDYGMSAWPGLPGTATEAQAIAAIAPGQKEALRDKVATADKLKALLPQARLLHLATHGEFKAKEFVQEQERARKARDSAQLGDGPRGIGAKNPLGYVGIVLAGGEVLSGLNIVDLPLENLHLVTLSACETGLGPMTGGEGVQGLQRAFHLAGCPNVVASLWKVNDAATAALMTKFYHELWVSKKPPIEALREAQLTIYRRPDLIATLASAERGLKLEQALNDKSTRAAEAAKDRTPTKLWAAFVLSGVGR